MEHRLGEELARLRQVKGRSVSLREVERQTGISNEYLSQLERGVATKPAPDVLQKLAKFYGTPYESPRARSFRAKNGKKSAIS